MQFLTHHQPGPLFPTQKNPTPYLVTLSELLFEQNGAKLDSRSLFFRVTPGIIRRWLLALV